MDIFDLTGYFEDLISYLYCNLSSDLVLGALVGIGGLIYVFASILLLGLVAVAYAFPRTVTRNIGRKCGLKTDWMPYLPIANDIYRTRMVGFPAWRIVFFGFTGWLIIISGIAMLMLITLSTGMLIICAILFCAWLVMHIITVFKYFHALFGKFGYNPRLALLRFFGGFGDCSIGGIALFVLQIIIAYDSRVQLNGSSPKSAPASPSGAGAVAQPPSPPQSGAMVGISGSFAGVRHPIARGDALVLGRDPAVCNVVFDRLETSISKTHCRIEFDGQAYYVTDMSSNGTFINNGTRLAGRQRTAVARGSVIYLADSTERFRLE